MMRVPPSPENSILETFPHPTGRSKFSYFIYFQSLRLITLTLFYPARASLLYGLLTAIASRGALKTRLDLISPSI